MKHLKVVNTFDEFAEYASEMHSVELACYQISTDVYYWLDMNTIWGYIGYDPSDNKFHENGRPFTVVPRVPDPESFPASGSFLQFEGHTGDVEVLDSGWSHITMIRPSLNGTLTIHCDSMNNLTTLFSNASGGNILYLINCDFSKLTGSFDNSSVSLLRSNWGFNFPQGLRYEGNGYYGKNVRLSCDLEEVDISNIIDCGSKEEFVPTVPDIANRMYFPLPVNKRIYTTLYTIDGDIYASPFLWLGRGSDVEFTLLGNNNDTVLTVDGRLSNGIVPPVQKDSDPNTYIYSPNYLLRLSNAVYTEKALKDIRYVNVTNISEYKPTCLMLDWEEIPSWAWGSPNQDAKYFPYCYFKSITQRCNLTFNLSGHTSFSYGTLLVSNTAFLPAYDYGEIIGTNNNPNNYLLLPEVAGEDLWAFREYIENVWGTGSGQMSSLNTTDYYIKSPKLNNTGSITSWDIYPIFTGSLIPSYVYNYHQQANIGFRYLELYTDDFYVTFNGLISFPLALGNHNVRCYGYTHHIMLMPNSTGKIVISGGTGCEIGTPAFLTVADGTDYIREFIDFSLVAPNGTADEYYATGISMNYFFMFFQYFRPKLNVQDSNMIRREIRQKVLFRSFSDMLYLTYEHPIWFDYAGSKERYFWLPLKYIGMIYDCDVTIDDESYPLNITDPSDGDTQAGVDYFCSLFPNTHIPGNDYRYITLKSSKFNLFSQAQKDRLYNLGYKVVEHQINY